MGNSGVIKSVKVLGAGSIGNHMSHASRSMGWSVDLCDIDQAALDRTKNEIYPGRYENWDSEIKLHLLRDAPKGGFDMIIIGTPPDVHMNLALEALEEKPKALLIEKPLCGPGLEGAQELFEAAQKSNTRVFVGYDHVVGEASEKAAEAAKKLGGIDTLDVEFREYWNGIFAAHPWLDGPRDTYLGFWKRGGGASGEHSHAANLWQSFAHALGLGRVHKVSAMLDYVTDGGCDYDKLCMMNFETEKGILGRVVQDVVTEPPRKWARIQSKEAFVEWQCGFQPGCDAVTYGNKEGVTQDLVHKTRPDDFIRELSHIENAVSTGAASPIDLERGLETMLVVAAAHASQQQGCSITLDYSVGYTLEALVPTKK